MFAKAKAAAAAAAKSAAAASNAAASSAASAANKYAAAAKVQATKMSGSAASTPASKDSRARDDRPPPSYDAAVSTPRRGVAPPPPPGVIELDDLLSGKKPAAAPLSPTPSGVHLAGGPADEMSPVSLVPVPSATTTPPPPPQSSSAPAEILARVRELEARLAHAEDQRLAHERWKQSAKEANAALSAQIADALSTMSHSPIGLSGP